MKSALALAVVSVALLSSGQASAGCSDPAEALPVSRVVEIDTSTGPLYGEMSRFEREERFLAPKEVVLTFDDGPMPSVTNPILEALDRYCTKATFFYVGQMAVAYPAVVKDVIARGHTVGTHTWSHPMSLPRRSFAKATAEIDKGFAAVALAAGQPIAPFFRFPGLSDSDPLLGYLQTKGIAAFTVDVISNDSYTASPQRLTDRVTREIQRKDGGIVLFHDIKRSTAKALPGILAWLKANGYKVVHIRAKAPMPAVAGYDAELAPRLAKAEPAPADPHLLPASASAAPAAEATVTGPAPGAPAAEATTLADRTEPPVTALAPPARTRAPMPAAAAVAESEPDRTVGARRKSRTEQLAPPARHTAMRRKAKRQTVTFIGF